ncbi:MAG TPA: ArsC/Spx/MgsR family protein [Anaeromyxobacter sp.]|nr:ArsC/Spx/MgsR family protein [Anaeromyxobacter sp.]
MPGEYVLWFDARCSACKRAAELLRERGVEPVLRRFLEEPPTPDEVSALIARLGVSPHAVVREDADEYQALRLSARTPSDALVQAIAQHPRILERPILVAGDRAIVARPPERVLDLVPAAAPA